MAVEEAMVAAIRHRAAAARIRGLGLVLAGLARVVRHALAVDRIADHADRVVRTTTDDNNAGHDSEGVIIRVADQCKILSRTGALNFGYKQPPGTK